MMIVEQLITSFIASSAFVVIFNAPKSSLVKCGTVGMGGWIIYLLIVDSGIDAVVASLVASFFVAVASQIIARKYKTPVIIFSVAGVIPLVPGGLAYDAMRKFVENDYNFAIILAAKAFLISGAIAIGLVFSEVVNQSIRQSKFRLNMNEKYYKK